VNRCGVDWLCGVVWCGVVWCGVVWCGVVWCGNTWCTPKSSFSPSGKLAREWKTAKYAKSVMTRATDVYCTCHVGERERGVGES